jgi:nitroimidazol reductase NimA-like FMN-containing flavoprotein (pyridoxamine 5'-phosphate oxidase superfamily)
MGIKLTAEEIDEFLSNGHTLIVSTIRKSGEPFMTPVWYVWERGSFYVSTPARSAKVQHLKRDRRACCLVEDGEAWVDLRAVIANCDAEFVTDPATIERIAAARESKYARFKADPSRVPSATSSHYAAESALIRMTPRPGEVRSWHNRKIRLRQPT